jgi:hypothetical protein
MSADFKKSFFRTVVWLTVLVATCAKQGFPPGGPEDRIPPEVLGTMPENGQTHVDIRTRIVVWFSEPVKTRVSADAVFLSPFEGENARLRWSGNKLTISFRRPLREACTYVVTLGTSVQDLRGNRMAASATFAFSTGDVLDQGRITGRVSAGAGASGVDVWAYKCDGGMDPDPSAKEPDYIVQSSEDGAFAFTHVASVRTRLFAVRDRNADRLYQAGEDEIGVAPFDAVPRPLDTLDTDSCIIRLRRVDPSPPSLVRVTAVDRNHVSLRFDRVLTPLSDPPASAASVTGGIHASDSLRVLGLALNDETLREMLLATGSQIPGAPYKVALSGDWAESRPDTGFWTGVFTGSADADTVRPKLVYAFPKSGVTGFHPSTPVRLTFSEPLDSARFVKAFVLADSADSSLAGRFRWRDASDVLFVPDEPLRERAWYTVRVGAGEVADFSGNAAPDTVIRFRTMTLDTLSEIAGTVRASRDVAASPFFITARQVRNKDVVCADTVPKPGAYRIGSVLPGEYLLDCYIDLDGNGRYSFGRPYPFLPAEPFLLYGDTVKARSRWPNDGNDLVVP